MSDVSHEKAKQRQAVIERAIEKYGTPPEGKSALWADYDLVDDLAETLRFMCDTRITSDGAEVPRFGVLSLIMQTTPCYVYGHPALKKLCRTAFTDGVHVFVDDEFYAKLLKDVRESRGAEYGIEPLLLHEVMHKMFNHVERLRQFPQDIANRAADLSINTKLKAGFPELEWCKSLRETGLGFRPGDVEKYLPMSEESIARELVLEEMKNRQNQQGQGNQKGQQGQNQGQQGQGGGGQGQGQQKGQPGQNQGGGQPSGGQGQGQQDPNDPNQGQDPQDGQQPSDGFNEDGDNHLVSLRDLIEALEEAGLDEVRDMLNLPSSDEVDEIGRVMDENRDRQHEAIQKAASDAARLGGKYPGAHIAEAAADYLKGFGKAKLSWKLKLRDLILGVGNKYKPSYEVISDLAYVDELTDDLGTELVLPIALPHANDESILVLVDTSGSVSQDDLRAFFTEIFELKTASEGLGDAAAEVYVLSADTVLRGDPIEITDDNVDELMETGVKVFGRGGTDLADSLKNALTLPLLKEKKIKTVIYFTDLFDRPPQFKDLGVEEDTTILYVAAPTTHSSHQEEFARAVESYAQVVPIKEGIEVDLSDDAVPSKSPNRRISA